MRKFIVSRYEIESEKIGDDGVKIALLSDFHNNSYGIDENKLYEAIVSERPDFVIVAGDMFTGEPGYDNGRADTFLRRLAKDFTIYYGMGNHEHRIMLNPDVYPGMYEPFEKMIKETGIRLLQNETVEIEKNGTVFAIHGLMIGQEFYRKFTKTSFAKEYVENRVGKADACKYNILIAHHPAFFESYANWGADLVLSGHLHGGMARLPYVGGVISPDYRLFPKYDKGRFDKGDATMILSAGLGMHTINMRPFNPPELVIIDLK